jgi:hypothetical protein
MMTCADGYIRHCYPVIAGIMADYEEQVLITGVFRSDLLRAGAPDLEHQGDIPRPRDPSRRCRLRPHRR